MKLKHPFKTCLFKKVSQKCLYWINSKWSVIIKYHQSIINTSQNIHYFLFVSYIVNHYTFFVSILRHESRDHWQSTVEARKNPSSCIIPQPHPLSLVNKPTLFWLFLPRIKFLENIKKTDFRQQKDSRSLFFRYSFRKRRIKWG